MENPKPTHRDRETGMLVVVTPAVKISAPWAERPDWYMDAADAEKMLDPLPDPDAAADDYSDFHDGMDDEEILYALKLAQRLRFGF